MRNSFISILGRLSVGKKLLLIYLLDLTAVIYISSILINEKYIAINFARDELRGNAYIATARDGLIDVALVGAGGATDVRSGLPARVTALSAVEQRLGEDMGNAELNAALVKSLAWWPPARQTKWLRPATRSRAAATSSPASATSPS